MPERNEKFVKEVESLARPLAASLGLSIWGIEVQLSSRSIVKVYAETLAEEEDLDLGEASDLDEGYESEAGGGINIDQCAELSRLLGLSLEVEDLFSGAYVLEVSSPGLDRLYFNPEQLKMAVGRQIEAKIHSPIEAFPRRRNFSGILKSVDGENIVIEVDVPEPAIAHIDWSNIRRIQEVFEPPEKPLPGKGPSTGAGKKKSRRSKKRRKSNAKSTAND